MKYIARVSPRYFAAATIWMGQGDVRHYLNGVAIQPHPEKGALIVATDGHTIAAIHDPDGWCERDIIVGAIPKPLIAACKAKGKRNELLTAPRHLWIAEDGAVVQGGEVGDNEIREPASPFEPLSLFACKIQLVDARYPDWRRVISATAKKIEEGMKPTAPASANPKYLARLAETARVFGATSKYASATGYQYSPTEVILYRLFMSGDPEFGTRSVFGIMPMRDEVPTNPVPAAISMAPKKPDVDSAKPGSKPRVQVLGGKVVNQEAEEATE